MMLYWKYIVIIVYLGLIFFANFKEGRDTYWYPLLIVLFIIGAIVYRVYKKQKPSTAEWGVSALFLIIIIIIACIPAMSEIANVNPTYQIILLIIPIMIYLYISKYVTNYLSYTDDNNNNNIPVMIPTTNNNNNSIPVMIPTTNNNNNSIPVMIPNTNDPSASLEGGLSDIKKLIEEIKTKGGAIKNKKKKLIKKKKKKGEANKKKKKKLNNSINILEEAKKHFTEQGKKNEIDEIIDILKAYQ